MGEAQGTLRIQLPRYSYPLHCRGKRTWHGWRDKEGACHVPNDETVICVNGDVLTDLPLSRMVDSHKASGVAATMLVVPYESSFGVVHIDKLKMVRGLRREAVVPHVDQRRSLRLQRKEDDEISARPGRHRKRVVSEDGRRGELASYPYYGDWWYIDSVKDLKELEVSLKSSK